VLHRRDTEEEVDPNHRPLVDSRPFFIETKSDTNRAAAIGFRFHASTEAMTRTLYGLSAHVPGYLVTRRGGWHFADAEWCYEPHLAR
jgi:hypothetical protein